MKTCSKLIQSIEIIVRWSENAQKWPFWTLTTRLILQCTITYSARVNILSSRYCDDTRGHHEFSVVTVYLYSLPWRDTVVTWPTSVPCTGYLTWPTGALSVMAGRTVGLSHEYRLFDPNSPSRLQNGISMPYLLAGSIGNNDVTCALVPVVRV